MGKKSRKKAEQRSEAEKGGAPNNEVTLKSIISSFKKNKPKEVVKILKKNPGLDLSQGITYGGASQVSPLMFVHCIKAPNFRSQIRNKLLELGADPFAIPERQNPADIIYAPIIMANEAGDIDDVFSMLKMAANSDRPNQNFGLENLQCLYEASYTRGKKLPFLSHLVWYYVGKNTEKYKEVLTFVLVHTENIIDIEDEYGRTVLDNGFNRFYREWLTHFNFEHINSQAVLGDHNAFYEELEKHPVAKGLRECIEILIRKNPNMDRKLTMQCGTVYPLLSLPNLFEDRQLYELMIGHGADPSILNDSDVSAIVQATRFEETDHYMIPREGELTDPHKLKIAEFCRDGEIEVLKIILALREGFDFLISLAAPSEQLSSNGYLVSENLHFKCFSRLKNQPLPLLMHSCINNQPQVTDLLLTQGQADPNCQLASGETPLYIAFECQDMTQIPLLLSHNANPTLGPDHQTPLSFAIDQNFQDGLGSLAVHHPHIFNDLLPEQRFHCIDLLLSKVKAGEWDDFNWIIQTMALSLGQLQSHELNFYSALVVRFESTRSFEQLHLLYGAEFTADHFFKSGRDGTIPVLHAKLDMLLALLKFFRVTADRLQHYIDGLPVDDAFDNLNRHLLLWKDVLIQRNSHELSDGGSAGPLAMIDDSPHSASGRAFLISKGFTPAEIELFKAPAAAGIGSPETTFFEDACELPTWFDGRVSPDPANGFLKPVENKPNYYYWLSAEFFREDDVSTFLEIRSKMVREQAGEQGIKPITSGWTANVAIGAETVESGPIAYEIKSSSTKDRLLAVDLLGSDGCSHLIIPCYFYKGGLHTAHAKSDVRSEKVLNVEIPFLESHGSELSKITKIGPT